jgi:replicative DNA helicase
MNLVPDTTDLNSYVLPTLAAMEAEHGLIGGLLLDNSAFDRISDKLRPEHFFSSTNRDIYAEISRQIGSGGLCDVVTVATAMHGKLEMSDLARLAQYVPSAANIRRYADMVIERFKSRALMSVSSELNELAQDHQRSIEDRVDCAQGQLSKLIDEAPRDDWVSAWEGMNAHTQVLEDRADGKIHAWPTGLTDLDEIFEGGLRQGELVIIGARPSMGKTALAMTIGLEMARDYSVAMLSMEMTHIEVRDRVLAMVGNVSLSSVKRPSRGEGLKWDRVVETIEKSKGLNWYVSDQSGLNINQVRSKARNLKRLHGLNVLIVDYIGLMVGLDPKQSRAYQLEEISRGLKNLAKELGIAVICLAQLNREVEKRVDAMPIMSDLRDCGAIEQDADTIVFVHRPYKAKPDLGPEWQHYAKASVAKNRNGPCGLLDLSYIGDRTKFGGWSGPAPMKASNKGKDL